MNATSTALSNLSAELAGVVAAHAPSVVYVDAHPRRDASGIVWDDHHVVTVAHAIDREDDITLLLASGGKASATLVGLDRSTDIAVLRSDTALSPAARASSDELAVGNLVLALAREEDGALGASFGIVSSLDGAWRTWRGGHVERFVRPDVNAYQSFSGGPLVSATGGVVGMNTWALSRRNAITLPLVTLERVAGELTTRGRVSRGWLGVALQSVRLPDGLRAAHNLAQSAGAIVVGVAAGGPADRAGITLGDVLLAIGTDSTEDSDDVQRALAAGAGTTKTVRVLRAGEVREISVTFAERPHDE